MASFSRFVNGFRALLRKRRVEQELDDELRVYVEASVEEKIRGGMAPEEAMRAARVEIGRLEAVKDHTRDVGWESRVEALWQDVRYAIRMIRRAPAFTAVAVVTIGIGVGAATSMFAAMRTLLVAPPPHIVSPERVFRLHLMMPSQDPEAEPRVHDRTAYPIYELLADRAESLSAVAPYTRADFAVGSGADARMAHVEMVSAGFWRAVGARPSLGRFIRDEEAHPATGARVVVLSHTFWATQFGGSAGVIGRSLSIKGQPYEIIGVAPRAFRGVELAGVDLWLPLFALDEDGTGRPATWHRFETSSNLKVVVVVNETMARLYWPDRVAVGECIYAREPLAGVAGMADRSGGRAES